MDTLLKNLKTAIFNVMEKIYFLLPDIEGEAAPVIDNGQTINIGIT